MGFFKHESAYVDEGAEIGEGTSIWHFSHVQGPSRIGARCSLGQNVNVDRNVVLGDRVRVQNNVSIYNGVVCEDDVFLGPSCVFTNVFNPRSHVPRKDEFRPTVVGRGATIGANATVVCGNPIGRFAMVGAGSVVTTEVPPYALVYGVPARMHGWVCQCGVKLDLPRRSAEPLETVCSSCGDRYRLQGNTLTPVAGEQ